MLRLLFLLLPCLGAEPRAALLRTRRGFTYPGTLWCGAGNIANSYEQLGEFAATDSCCRVHDHCPHVIHAFSRNYGYTNFKWHSISHCNCDNQLKECLGKVNDTASRVVGQAFFNVIEVPCFDFMYEEQCVERHWYGMCKTYDQVPIAVMKESIPYDFGGIAVIDELTLAPPARKEKTTGGQQDQTSQSSDHEDPSLSNMVTAAEDFIKVLATVSTSKSSSTEAAKKEEQDEDKKKKSQKKKAKKSKGRGKKRKHRIHMVSRTEEPVAVAPSPKPEDLMENSLESHAGRDEPSAVESTFREQHGEETPKNFMTNEPQGESKNQLDCQNNQKRVLLVAGNNRITVNLPKMKRRKSKEKHSGKKRRTITSVPVLNDPSKVTHGCTDTLGSNAEIQIEHAFLTTPGMHLALHLTSNRPRFKERLANKKRRKPLLSSPLTTSYPRNHEALTEDNLTLTSIFTDTTTMPPHNAYTERNSLGNPTRILGLREQNHSRNPLLPPTSLSRPSASIASTQEPLIGTTFNASSSTLPRSHTAVVIKLPTSGTDLGMEALTPPTGTPRARRQKVKQKKRIQTISTFSTRPTAI